MFPTMRGLLGVAAMACFSVGLGPAPVAGQDYSPPNQDIWTTSVYSFAPAGGGPGGGLADENLKVGGWGDLYYSLMQFNLTGLPQNAPNITLRLYNQNASSGTPTALYLYRSGAKVAQHPKGLTLTMAPGGGARWRGRILMYKCKSTREFEATVLGGIRDIGLTNLLVRIIL
jgi:hypothetical protein